MENERGTGGTLSGNKRLVYALLKIFKKIFVEADNESSTSFMMKYTVENALKESKYETEPVTKSLKMVLQNWTSTDNKFVGVCQELREIGVKGIQFDFETEGGGLVFTLEEGRDMDIEAGEPKEVSLKTKVYWILAVIMGVMVIGGIVVGIQFNKPGPKPCGWQWAEWSQCSKTCGPGIKERNPIKIRDEELGGFCDIPTTPDQKSCDLEKCLIDRLIDEFCKMGMGESIICALLRKGEIPDIPFWWPGAG